MLQSDYKPQQATPECDLSHIWHFRPADMLVASDAEAARCSGFPEARGTSRGLMVASGERHGGRPSKQG